ncbi:nicotinamidase-related amidase [Sphingomonas zeicaulis]|uniref:cysteine hydrolase family protein n=1 Tax=Sphingomonas zeicaulis TaxID=1632740 RepID=UPI003D1C41EC
MHPPLALPDWAIARGRGLNAFDRIIHGRTALVVIDMQRAFVSEGEVFGNANARAIVAPVNRLAAVARAAGMPVIWTRQTVSDLPPLAMPDWQYDRGNPHVARAIEALRVGAAPHALHDGMAIAAGDVILDKYRYGAFICPAGQLARALEARGIEMILVAGTLTNVCVESTARDGNMLGYRVVVASDATAAVSDIEHDAALLNLGLNFADVKTVAEVEAML